MMDRFVVALLSFFLGFALFFGTVVAPAIFGTVGAKTGGEIVSKIFPYYFAAATSLLGLASILALKGGWRKASFALLVATVIAAFEEFFVLPTAEKLKFQSHGEFLFWHKVSVFLNGVEILIVAVVLIWFLFFEGKTKKEKA
jgi:hypothetical protein